MIKLYNEDCLKIMAQMPDKTVDLLYTDPPYDISATNGGGYCKQGQEVE